jgi:IS605 OrfB family transposase
MNITIKRLVDHCLENRIGTILIGDLKGMKQQINLGKSTNQKIVQIPWYKFKQSLKSKCKRAGINFVLVDEAYTSQVDSCAFDPIEKPPYGRKRRIQRGLYNSSTGTLINADVNGALNIMRKVVGDFHVSEIIDRGLVNRPKRIMFGFFRPGWSSTNFS